MRSGITLNSTHIFGSINNQHTVCNERSVSLFSVPISQILRHGSSLCVWAVTRWVREVHTHGKTIYHNDFALKLCAYAAILHAKWNATTTNKLAEGKRETERESKRKHFSPIFRLLFWLLQSKHLKECKVIILFVCDFILKVPPKNNEIYCPSVGFNANRIFFRCVWLLAAISLLVAARSGHVQFFIQTTFPTH